MMLKKIVALFPSIHRNRRPRQALLWSFAGLGVGFFYLGIDSAWLQEQIVSRVEESLEAEIQLQNLEVNPFTGSATLVGVDFLRKGDTSNFRMVADRIDLNLELMPLMGGELHFQTLNIDTPTLHYQTWPPTEPPEEEQRPPMEFDEFIIDDGEITIMIQGAADDAFEIAAQDISYRNTDIDLGGVGKTIELFYGADVETTLNINGPVPLEKQFKPEQTTIVFRDIDAAYFDRHFGRGKGFRVAEGSFSIEGKRFSDRVVQEMVIRDLRLERTPNGAWGETVQQETPDVLTPKFDTSVPDELRQNRNALLEYVERQNGNVSFAVTETDQSLIPEDNTHAFLRWWWLQVWTHLATEAAGEIPA